MKLKEFQLKIHNGILPERLLLFLGPENFLKEETVKRVRNIVAGTEDPYSSYERLNCEGLALETVISTIETPCFGSRDKLVVLDNFFRLNQNQIGRFCFHFENKGFPEFIVLIINHDSTRPGGENDTAEFFRELFVPVYFYNLYAHEIPYWIRNRFKALHKIADLKACTELQKSAGSDLMNLNTEINKIHMFYWDKNNITVDDVKKVVSRTPTAAIFDYLDAVGKRNTRLALEKLKDIYVLGEHPLKILSMLGPWLRFLLQAKLLEEKYPEMSRPLVEMGKRYVEIEEDTRFVYNNEKKILKSRTTEHAKKFYRNIEENFPDDRNLNIFMQYPETILKSFAKSCNFTREELFTGLEEIVETEGIIKSGGGIDPATALDVLTVKICYSAACYP